MLSRLWYLEARSPDFLALAGDIQHVKLSSLAVLSLHPSLAMAHSKKDSQILALLGASRLNYFFLFEGKGCSCPGTPVGGPVSI